MPLRWRSRRRFDGITAGKRSLAGQERTVDIDVRIVDNHYLSRRRTCRIPI